MKDDNDRTLPNLEDVLEAYAVVANRVATRVLVEAAAAPEPADVQLLHALSQAVVAIGSEFARGVTAHSMAAASDHGNRRIVQ